MWKPRSQHEFLPRSYNIVKYRPLPESGITRYGNWISEMNWNEIYSLKNVDEKTEKFQQILYDKFVDIFPQKSLKICNEDKPWITKDLKNLDRKKGENLRNIKNHLNGEV